MIQANSTRVLYIDCSPFFGGAQRSLSDLLGSVRDCGVCPRVIAADTSSRGLVYRCRDQGIPVVPIVARHWGRSVSSMVHFAVDRLRSGDAFSAVLQEWAPDMVHANGVRSALLAQGRLPSGLPLLVHDRDNTGPRLALKIAGRGASRVVAITRFVARRWDGIVSPDRVQVIPNGLDIHAIVREGRQGARPSDGSFRAILVADFVRWKRHALFLEALASARATGRDVRGAVVGRARDDSGRAYLRELRALASRLRLSDVLEFVVDADSAIPFIASSDVLVSVAAGEPFGRTVVEALALGIPVVATGGGGPEEILEGCDAGSLVAGTPDAVRDGILGWCSALANPVSIRQSARDRAAVFGVDRMVEQICDLYGQVMNERGR